MLEEVDLRLTPQRQAVLNVVREATDHPTAAEIYDRVRNVASGIAYATVYNALSFLVEHGLVRELKFGNGASRYDGRLEPHVHVVCTQCGALDEADLSLPRAVVETVSRATRYNLGGHIVQLFGVCPRCSGVATPT